MRIRITDNNIEIGSVSAYTGYTIPTNGDILHLPKSLEEFNEFINYEVIKRVFMYKRGASIPDVTLIVKRCPEILTPHS